MAMDKFGREFDGELRAPSPQPTKSGWYYCLNYLPGPAAPPDRHPDEGRYPRRICPVYVHFCKNKSVRVYYHSWRVMRSLADIDWYGPCPDVREG